MTEFTPLRKNQDTDGYVESTVVLVPSESESGRFWHVIRGRTGSDGRPLVPWSCDCPSYHYDAGHYDDEPSDPGCKHIEMVKDADQVKSA